MDAAVLTVGDELLSGDTTNTNAAWLGRRLDARGVTVRRGVVVPDEVDAIACTTNHLADAYDAVLVTGGLGPTHDDVTMAGVADAFDRELAEHPDAVAWFEDHRSYQHAELAAGTTHLPEGSRLLPNEEGVAPGAVVEHPGYGAVYVLPGVPDEMKEMFERIESEFEGPLTYTETVFSDEPESALIELFDRVQDEFDVAIGSYPGDGVRITVKSADEAEAAAAAAWLEKRV